MKKYFTLKNSVFHQMSLLVENNEWEARFFFTKEICASGLSVCKAQANEKVGNHLPMWGNKSRLGNHY